MRNLVLIILAASWCPLAQAQGNVTTQSIQEGGNVMFFQAQGAGPVGAVAGFGKAPGAAPVQGAPYSATIVIESVQTLADGNRIVMNSGGAIARDALGRTRQETTLPSIGNLSATNAPHIVFIQDPPAQTSYTLNLTDKTAQKMPLPPGGAIRTFGGGGPNTATVVMGGPMPPVPPVPMTAGVAVAAGAPLPPPMPPPPAQGMFFVQKLATTNDPAETTTEDLGSRTIEGVPANGTRSTRTIPAGQIGNEMPLAITTEVWTSPDLKAIVYSKRSDPRMGEQTFRLTNITRADPDPALFTVPSDFQIIDGPQPILYSPKP